MFRFLKYWSNRTFYLSKIIVDHMFVEFWFRFYAFAKDTTFCMVLHWSFPSLLLRFLLISPLSFVIFSFFSVCVGVKKFFIHDDQIYVEKKVYSKWQTSRCRLGNFPVLNRTHGLSCLLRWLMLLHKVIYFCGKLCVLCCASFIVSMNYSLSLIRPSTILKAISVLAFYLSNDYD